jgi:hypothetical protein
VSTATFVRGTRPAPGRDAQWWRMAFKTTEEVVMTEAPTTWTWTFPDGFDEDITPSGLKHKQPTTRLPEGGLANWTGQGTTRRVASMPEFS